MDIKENIFKESEKLANEYVARSLLVSSGIVALIWLLNYLRIFTSDMKVVNIVMPIGILFLIVPVILIKVLQIEAFWIKYLSLFCFVVGIGVLYIGLTFQVVVAWFAPIALSRHYYSKKAIHFTFVATVIIMLITLYIALYYGIVDANMLLTTRYFHTTFERKVYIASEMINGTNLLKRAFVNFYIPRLCILGVVYAISLSLSKRTHSILLQQEKDLAEKKRIDAELSVASQIQTAMLPDAINPFPEYDAFDVYAMMVPTKEVGGDFYDFFLIDEDHLALIIADVSGKGVPAAMFMMSTKIRIKNLVMSKQTPQNVLKEANNQLFENNENKMSVSMWLGIYEISTGKLTACNAGHESPIWKTNGVYTQMHNPESFALGSVEAANYMEYEVKLQPGNVMFLYTNGVTKTVNPAGELYGLQKLLEGLNTLHTDSLAQTLENIKNNMDTFAEEAQQDDDITMLAIQINEI
ncbi:PP2C family protein-serine/threonine phosphatase [Chakrabartyella piscis]|uniref:PP2C family protein-serine/threonine phosphatase n=1 Tax=Chakrabartyella piscis TaxID=2918914 RepID=UPI002958B9DA|nr:PP2C family protein-serine/threonine phosphatase [Chakrabartyella piscis]